MLIQSVLGSSIEEAKYERHLELLCDAGLMTQVSDSGFRMTNYGHDYLEAIRSDTTWNKTNEGAKQIGGATLATMFDIAVAYAKQEAAAKLGIDIYGR